tara:strand:- start:107 stop:952 length:846 start_codon:yes stop_codon:yes gene_type:complete
MNYLSTLNYGYRLLKSNNIISYKLDSELLLANTLNKTREEVLTNLNFKLEKKEFDKFKKLLIRRKQKEPIAYIFKKKDFWKQSFFVNKDVLIPRPETEIIVEEVLKLTDDNHSKRILDVGTGSGCIILSIFKERPNFFGTAIDICKKAIKIASYNAKMHHLDNKIKFININIDKFNNNKYDLIISNPPYINNINYKRLEINVKQFEPKIALKAGIDGLKIIKKLIFKSKELLKRNGKLVFEIGENQETKIKKLLMRNRFYVDKVCKDIKSHPRVIIAKKLF